MTAKSSPRHAGRTSPVLGPDHVDFLRSLVRVEIRRRRRMLEQVRPRGDQTDADLAGVRATMTSKIAHAEGTLAALEQRAPGSAPSPYAGED